MPEYSLAIDAQHVSDLTLGLTLLIYLLDGVERCHA
jgi:hypothetical protein